MHKKLASELNSLAHDILKMSDKDDIFTLKNKVSVLYDKLSVLAYIEEYINTTPQVKVTKQELIAKLALAEKLKEEALKRKDNSTDEIKTKNTSNLDADKKNVEVPVSYKAKEGKSKKVILSLASKTDVNEIELIDEEIVTNSITKVEKKLVEDLTEKTEVTKVNQNKGIDAGKINSIKKLEPKNSNEDNISEASKEIVLEQKFEKSVNKPDKKEKDKSEVEVAEGEQKRVEVKDYRKITLSDELKDTLSVDVMTDLFSKVEPRVSINDKASINKNIQIGLNDRIAFVNNLFAYDQSEFNRVIRELNLFQNLEDSVKYIRYSVKPNQDWTGKEAYEERLIEIIGRRFQ